MRKMIRDLKPGDMVDLEGDRFADPTQIKALADDLREPRYGRDQFGYGRQIPTRHKLLYLNRWRRVFVCLMSNAGTAYVLVKGEWHVLDVDTEYAFQG